MGKRKERRLAALNNAGRRVKLDLFAEPPGTLSLYIYVCMYVCMCIKRIIFSSFEVCGSVRVSFLIKFKEDIFDSFSFCSDRVSFLMKFHVLCCCVRCVGFV